MSGKDLIVLVFAIGAAACLLVLVVYAVIRPESVSQETRQWLGALLGAMVGSVATYIGLRRDST